MIPDASVDFVFSFDSFVHPDRDVVEVYLRQLGTKLKIGGKGFIHHSNFGEYVNIAARTASGSAREAVDQGEDSRLGASSKPRHDRRVISRAVGAKRAAMPESGAGELAWETPDRLPFAFRAK